MLDKKAFNIKVIYVDKLTSLTDVFIVCSYHEHLEQGKNNDTTFALRFAFLNYLRLHIDPQSSIF